MNDLLIQTLENFLPYSKQKKSYGYNICCPVCTTLGNQKSPDKRFRCGIKMNNNSLRIHCFNCGFTTGYESGSRLGNKLKQFLSALNVPEDQIKLINLKTLISQNTNTPIITKQNIIHSLPNDAITLEECINNEILESELVVKLWLDRIPFYPNNKLYFSPSYKDLLIFPIIKDNNTVGWIGRTVLNKIPKYHANYENKLLYNNDLLNSSIKNIFVTEGVFDAISINGVAIMGNKMNEEQIDVLKKSNKTIIIVPDADYSGIELCKQALEHNFKISYPGLQPYKNAYWNSNIKDANQAVLEMGRLYTVYSLLQHATNNIVTIKNIIKDLEARK